MAVFGFEKVVLKTDGPTDGQLKMAFDAAVFLSEIDLKTQNLVMIPCETAVRLAEKAARAFKILE